MTKTRAKTRTEAALGTRTRRQYLQRAIGLMTTWIQHRLAKRFIADGYPALVAPSFDHIGIRINSFGRYENDEIDALIIFLRERGLISGDCVDVGANIGNHSLAFAGVFDTVHSFEPGPLAFELLQINCRGMPSIKTYNVGLSDQPQQANWSAPNGNLGEGQVATDPRLEGNSLSTEVSLVSLDEVESLSAADIGLIKIDVEGHELKVINGAISTITRASPVIVFELHASSIHNGSSALVDRLRDLGYGNFQEFTRSPLTGNAAINFMLRMALGERYFFHEVAAFENKFYPMIIALRGVEAAKSGSTRLRNEI